MTTRARSRSSPSACVRLRGRGDDRWTRCSELLVSIRERSTRQPELPQAGPSDSQRGGRARALLNTANCRAAARAPSVQTTRFECRACYFPLLSHGHKSRYGRRGVTCAAVLLVRLAPPLPRFHPGTRGGYKLTIAKTWHFLREQHPDAAREPEKSKARKAKS